MATNHKWNSRQTVSGKWITRCENPACLIRFPRTNHRPVVVAVGDPCPARWSWVLRFRLLIWIEVLRTYVRGNNPNRDTTR